MKPLLEYIQEEQKHELVTEGLFSWLKKLWKKVFSDTDNIISKNDGDYKISGNVKDVLAKSKKISGIKICEMNDEMFINYIKKTKSDKSDGPFYDAYEYYLKNPEYHIAAVATKQNDTTFIIGFRFAKLKKEGNKKIVIPQKFIPSKDLLGKKGELEISPENKEILNDKYLDELKSRKNVKVEK